MKKELEERFAEPLDEFYKRRIIFWNDEDRDFEEEVTHLTLSNAKVIMLNETNQFVSKQLLSSTGQNGTATFVEKWNMDEVLNQKEVSKHDEPVTPKKRKKQVRELQRTVFFGQANLSSAEDVAHYVANIKNRLLSYINDEEVEIK